jgi:probable F420-dependent oxidoreductase
MQLGLFLNTHGVTNREERDWWHQAQPVEEMRPVESARLAERLGFHSVWMGDHVALPEESPESVTPIGGEMRRHYPPRPNILDGAVVMGAIAQATTRIRMAPGVLISPYRHPLSDARQFATVDVLSNGRLIMGVGAGWMKEEFETLGHAFHRQRRSVLEECIRIYDLAWREGAFSFHGRFYDFDHVGVFPLPVQRPRPPIVVGATTVGSAPLMARLADGFVPLLTRPDSRPTDFAHVQDAIRRQLDAIGRPEREFAMVAFVSFRLSTAGDEEARRVPRWNLGGTPEQVLEDLRAYAAAGYSLMNMAPIVPSMSYAEFEEQTEWLARDVLPEARGIEPAGDWRTDL